MTPHFFIHTPDGRQGPFSEEDVLDFLGEGKVQPDWPCEDARTGRIRPLSDVFEVFEIPPNQPSTQNAPSTPSTPAATTALGETKEDADAEEENEDQESNAEEEDPNTTLYQGHPALFVYWKSLLLAAGIAPSGWWFAPQFGGGISLGISLAAVLLVSVAWRRAARTYLVSAQRVELLEGILSKSSREVRIQDIRSINVRKRGLQGLLGIGTVEFTSAGGEGVEVAFTDVWAAHKVKRLVRQLQEALNR